MEREIDVGGTSESLRGEDLETRVQQLEEAVGALSPDATLRNLPYGTLKEAKSVFALRSVGGASGGAYPAGNLQVDILPGNHSVPANYLIAVPFYLPGAPNTVTKIGIRVTTGGAGSFRLGIYADKGEARLYPGKLLLDAGIVSAASAGVKSVTMRLGLPRGLVWAAIVGDSAAPVILGYAADSKAWSLLGRSELGTAGYTHYRVSQAYGALPDPCPGVSESYLTFPHIFLKFG